MKFIIGTKQEMTQLFDEKKGAMIPVTKVTAGPCFVTQIKKQGSDNVSAVQIAYGVKNKITKPLKGHVKDIPANAHLREFRVEDDEAATIFTIGDKITAKQFVIGDAVAVTGISKGKGFQGVVKRHGFSGSPKSHGHKDQLRMPGSIGATDPGHVFKGTRMAGRMGGERTTVVGLTVVRVDSEAGTLFIKGAVPGARGALILIFGVGKMVPEKDEVSKKEAVSKGKGSETEVTTAEKNRENVSEGKDEKRTQKKEDLVPTPAVKE